MVASLASSRIPCDRFHARCLMISLPGEHLVGSIVKSLTVVSLALMVTSSPDGGVTKPPLTASCQTTTFWVPAGTFLIS